MTHNESKLQKENKFITELININGDEKQLQHFKEVFTDFIINSQNVPKYFVDLLDHYSFCRPHQRHVSKELMGCVYSCFPEKINEIQKDIKKTNLIKFIMFPEEFPMNENKEQEKIFLLLEKDDVDGFISFLSKNRTFDITKEQELERNGYYFILFDFYSISLIDFCCLVGSLKCFKFLLLNKCEITEKTLQWSIAGGNQEIINIL